MSGPDRWTGSWPAPRRRAWCQKNNQAAVSVGRQSAATVGSGQVAGPMPCFSDRGRVFLAVGGCKMCKAQNKTRNMLLATLSVALAALLAPAPAAHAQDKTF